jgi:5-methyltetrahydrofolate--homocysteine methyltransferase
MEQLCQLFQKEGLQIPIVVGGATTSTVHTAVKLAPLYDGCVVHGGDASQTSLLAKHLQMDAATTIAQIKAEQQTLRDAYEEHHAPLTPYAEANSKAPVLNNHEWHETTELSGYYGSIPMTELTSLIDWRMFLLFWGFKGETLQQLLVNPEAERTLKEGQQYLQRAIEQGTIEVQALLHYEPAIRRGNDIVLADDANGKCTNGVLPMLRSQSAAGHYLCLSDFFDEQAPTPLGLFTVVARSKQQSADEGERLMSHAICARLAEACAEHLQHVAVPSSQFSPLRVAFGYATCPDHSLKRIVFDLLGAEDKLDIRLTDHYSIQPSTSICGLFICHPDAHYFPVGRIDEDQLEDYCQRRGISVAEGEQLLSKYIATQSS